MTSDVCVGDLVCEQVLDLPGIPTPATCSAGMISRPTRWIRSRTPSPMMFVSVNPGQMALTQMSTLSGDSSKYRAIDRTSPTTPCFVKP